MQEHTNKDQEIRARRASPIHIVDTSRANTPNADALREVQLSLARAEQNLYNLVQASHVGNGASFAPTGFGFPTPQAFTPGYPPTGFAPASGLPTPATLAYGMAPGFAPWGSSPSTAWGVSPSATPWSPLVGSLVGPAALHHPATFATGGPVAPGTVGFNAGIIARTPAVDISDEGKQFVCLVDLPGIKAEQVELLCFEHAVVINAFRESEGEVLVQAERGNSVQQRTITLPTEILPGSAKATLSNGILTVVLPKANPTEGPRRIKVQG